MRNNMFSSYIYKYLSYIVDKKPIYYLLSLCILVSFWHYYFIDNFITRDEGVRLYQAQSILNGELLYVDTESGHTPGSFYLLALFFYLFGESLEVARLMILFFNLATIILVYYVSKSFWTNRVALLSATLYISGVVIYDGNLVFMAAISNFLVVLGSFFYMKLVKNNTYEPSKYFLYGLVLGLAAFVKQNAIPLCIGYALFEWFRIRANNSIVYKIKTYLYLTFISFVGFLTPFILLCIYYYYLGHLESLAPIVLVPATLRTYGGIYTIHLGFFQYIGFWIVLGYLFFNKFKEIYSNKKIEFDVENFLYVWTFFSFGVFLTSAIFRMYLLLPLAPASMLISRFIIDLLESNESERKIKYVTNVFLSKSIAVFISINIFSTLLVGSFLSPEGKLYDTDYDIFSRKNNEINIYHDQVAISEYISDNTYTNESILVFHASPSINFLSDRSSCTNYLVMHEARISKSDEKQLEIIEDMKRENVRYVVFADGFTVSEIQNLTDSNGELIFAPLVFNYIIENYTYEITIGEYWEYYVYVLND